MLVCTGHLCECQEDGGGARALLKDLSTASVEAQETSCLGMCGMGAMGCVEYADGSETLTHSRDQMLGELGVTVKPVECPVDRGDAAISRIMVCTGRMCNREKNGGKLLLEALRQEVPDPSLLEACACLGSCGTGSLVSVVYEDGCEEIAAGLRGTLKKVASRRGGDVTMCVSDDVPRDGWVLSPSSLPPSPVIAGVLLCFTMGFGVGSQRTEVLAPWEGEFLPWVGRAAEWQKAAMSEFEQEEADARIVQLDVFPN